MEEKQALVVICICLVIQLHDVTASAVTPGNYWTYRGSLGPDHWHLDYPHCGGVHQSPIDLLTHDVIVDYERLTPIVFSGYDLSPEVNYTLGNNGHTVQVDLNQGDMEIRAGGLDGTFVAQQFHFHWGAVDTRGSEHAVNGIHFPMEMHIVHFNKKYGDINNAMNKTDGLAVLGFFFEVGRFNSHFQEIINHFTRIQYKNEKFAINSIPLIELIPAKLSTYYRYRGSLTTPPCYESVAWTLFNETIEIAEEQLEEFRHTIYENDKSEARVAMDISDDFRPVQCLFRRKVYASHMDLKFEGKPSVQLGQSSDAPSVITSFFVTSLMVSLSCIRFNIFNTFI